VLHVDHGVTVQRGHLRDPRAVLNLERTGVELRPRRGHGGGGSVVGDLNINASVTEGHDITVFQRCELRNLVTIERSASRAPEVDQLDLVPDHLDHRVRPGDRFVFEANVAARQLAQLDHLTIEAQRLDLRACAIHLERHRRAGHGGFLSNRPVTPLKTETPPRSSLPPEKFFDAASPELPRIAAVRARPLHFNNFEPRRNFAETPLSGRLRRHDAKRRKRLDSSPCRLPRAFY
jgi:hypothetical protein